MKISTRFLIVWALVLIQFTAFATDYTVQVGDNFYEQQFLTIRPTDRVIFQYVGQTSHPTASDNGAWVTFPMNSANRTKIIANLPLGTYPYHCTAHGGPGFGQYGIITVSNVTPATEARPATPTLSVFPNPSRGMVTVSLPQAQKVGSDYKLRLSNIIGREVRTVALQPELLSAGLPIDLSDLPAGIYFYSLLAGDKVVTTKRLVLQN
ncbi:T9SS type A sorting domain-containing protein [Hymenobacter algoricola]|uniref:Secretion system C-terminal sorting domain-containing protein n=1 Tax=Hymenobacter algoricola TaxID=486267 RepID=A0ABP7MI39_9BACT